ncbi:hypothetical protein ACYTTR_17340, partial [Cobetia marina]
GIPGKRPEEIAIAVVAELLQLQASRAAQQTDDANSPTSSHPPSLDGNGLTRKGARQLRARLAPDAMHQTEPTRKAE